MPADFRLLLTIYQELYNLTDVAMTPLIGTALEQAGYDATYSLVSTPITNVPKLPEVLNYKHPKLTVKEPVLLDFGAAGKGYLIDIIAKILTDAGVTEFIVDGGGDMRASGLKTYLVGLENPSNTTEAIGVIELNNQSLCTSAGNRRTWGNYMHIINPHTKRSPTNISAIWATATSALLADALTTALQFAPLDVLQMKYSFEAMILYANGRVQTSSNWGGKLFT